MLFFSFLLRYCGISAVPPVPSFVTFCPHVRRPLCAYCVTCKLAMLHLPAILGLARPLLYGAQQRVKGLLEGDNAVGE